MSYSNAQCCNDFFEREPLPFPLKSCSVYQTVAKTNKEELVLTVAFDSVTKLLKYKYPQEFYLYSGCYYNEAIGLMWLNEYNYPVKDISIGRYLDYNKSYRYIYDYTISKYDVSGKLISFIVLDIAESVDSACFSEEFILHNFEKKYRDSTINLCRSDYSYNSFGMIESVQYYSKEDTVIGRWVYDQNKRLIKKEFFKKGQPIEEITYVHKDGYIYSEYFVYDYEEGKSKRENQEILLQVKFENNKLVYQAFSSDGVVRNETIYKYNTAGDLIECIYYDEKKVLDRIVKYKY